MGHAPWLPPARRGEADLLPSHDTCYKREVLLSYGDRLADLMMAEPVLMWRLRADGHRLFLEPNVKSLHGYTVSPLTWVAFFCWSRCFGDARGRLLGWSRSRRILHAVMAPFIPWVRAIRLFFYFLDRRPARLVTFLVGLPVILLAQYGAAIGEALGLLLGKGNAEVLFTQTHLRGLRLKADKPQADSAIVRP
jgi:hypothetical protein